MVPPHVICAKKTAWHAQKDNRLPTSQHPCHQRDTPHPVTLPPGAIGPSREEETVFDAWNGYHSVALHPDDRHYTTFITPWGRDRYHTAPQDYIASGDGYTRRYDEITSTIPNKTKCVDGTLLWSDTIEESFFQACNWLDTCGRHGVPSIPRRSVSPKTKSNSQTSKSPMTPCNHARNSHPHPTEPNGCKILVWFGERGVIILLCI